jgi:hypothetical protein
VSYRLSLFFTFHINSIYIVRPLYFRIFSASFLITILFPQIATTVDINIPFSLLRITMSGLLLMMVLLVFTS